MTLKDLTKCIYFKQHVIIFEREGSVCDTVYKGSVDGIHNRYLNMEVGSISTYMDFHFDTDTYKAAITISIHRSEQ